MDQFLTKHLIAAGYDVSAALNGCVDDADQLDDADFRRVVRSGMRALLSALVKRRKVTIPNGHTVQLPLFAAVKDGERWMRVSYLLADMEQLGQMLERERARHRRTTDRVERMARDLDLYRKHPDLPNVEAVWQAEGIVYRLAKAA